MLKQLCGLSLPPVQQYIKVRSIFIIILKHILPFEYFYIYLITLWCEIILNRVSNLISFLVGWLVGFVCSVLRHIKICTLFNAKSWLYIYIYIYIYIYFKKNSKTAHIGS